MTNDELTQHMRELLRIHTAKLSKYEPVPDDTIIEAMIAARNEALEEVVKELQNTGHHIENTILQAIFDAQIKLIRALKVQS